MLYRLVVNSPVYGQLEVAGSSIGRPDTCLKNINVRTWAINLYLLVYISMLVSRTPTNSATIALFKDKSAIVLSLKFTATNITAIVGVYKMYVLDR